MRSNFLLTFFSCFLWVINLQAQQQPVTGKVVSGSDGSVLPGVSVLIKGTTIGTVTDVSGNFTLAASPDNVLLFSFIGFETQEVRVGTQSSLTVTLQVSVATLQEVIVTGYATQRSQDITGAIATLSMKDEPPAPVATIGQMLQGKMAGVRVTQTSGRPGEGLKFQIRGATSLTAGSDPLFVVDGMPIAGDLNFLNPNEIENIVVLKDPASASLYGSRSANGVVLVTTKSGKSGKTQIDFNAYYGIESVPDNRRLEMMNAQERAQFQKEIAETNGRPVDPVFQNPEQYGEGTDWFDAITRTGAVQSYNLTISAGSEKVRTSATLGYFNQEGVVEGTSFERLSLRINTRYQISSKLGVGFNIAPNFTFDTNFNTDGWPYVTENIISSALLTSPIASPYNPDGTLALRAQDPASFGNPNWLRVAREKVYEDRDLRLLMNAYLEYELIEGLNFKSTFNVQSGNRNVFQFNPSTIGVLFIPPPRIPSGSDDTKRFSNWVNENTLSYQRKIGDDHSFDALVGFSAQKYSLHGNFINATNYPDDKIQTVNAAGITQVTSTVEEWSLLSYLARINYTYKDKYLFTLSARRDGSSRFGPENRWGSFPAASVGWIISKEGFWNVNPISFLKLRASYGVTGNYEIGNYAHLTTVGNSFYPFGNSVGTGRAPNNLGDQTLGWEENLQFNIGLDVNFFNDRFQFAYNFYNRNTTNLLFNAPVPLSSGFSNIQSNIGELKFWGHEFSLSGAIVNSNKLKWSGNVNVSFDRNETMSLATQDGILPSGLLLYQYRSHLTQVGQPVAMFYGAIHDGVYVNQADFDNSPKHESSQVGTVKFRDLNGDGIISFPDDMALIGSPWPKFTFGLTNNLTYNNFDLSFSIAGSYGNKVLAFHENWTTNLDGVFNVLSEVKNRWKSPEDPGDGKYGSVQQGTTFLERDRWNSRFLKDGSYLGVKNITLGYNLPLNPSSVFQRANIYVSSQNPFIFTKYTGPNPEVNTQTNGATAANQNSFGLAPGVDENSYPIPRTISLGVNLTF